MNVEKIFDIEVIFRIIRSEDQESLMDEVNEEIEDTVSITVTCDELSHITDCEDLDEIIRTGDGFPGIYTAVVEAIAEKYHIDPEWIDLIEDPLECSEK